MKRKGKKLWLFASCIAAFGLALWFVFLRLEPVITSRKEANNAIATSFTSSPKATATPLLDERGTIIPDWKTANPEAANMDWLNQGVWLKGTVPLSHPLSFSPNGR